MTANTRHRNEIIIRTRPSDVISITCEPKRHQRSRHHPMYILDTPSRQQSTPTLYIIGSTGNEYKIVVTTTSITCSCPDNHSGCKHILSLLHLTTTSHRRGNHIYVTPSYLIDKIQNGILLAAHSLDPLPNTLCLSTHQPQCGICDRPLSGTLSICSKCPFSYHMLCNIPAHTKTCPLCGNPLLALTSYKVDGYTNYSSILKHFLYPVNTAIHPYQPPLPPPRPQFDIHPQPNIVHRHDNIPAPVVIPPSPNGPRSDSSI
jgi:hypothetical protein